MPSSELGPELSIATWARSEEMADANKVLKEELTPRKLPRGGPASRADKIRERD